MLTDETVSTMGPGPGSRGAGDPELLEELRHALNESGLSLQYQPLVRSGDGEAIGFEALLRWSHPERGQISPGQFVPLAEQGGLMPRIGRWVLATAARQLAEWQRLGLAHDRSLHINFTTSELIDPGLTAAATAAVSMTGLRPEQICFEVTESSLQAGGRAAEEAVETMVAAGFRPVLDNFGPGSSIEILTRHPFAFAKIQHGLIAGDERPRNWARLLRGINGLARSLGITLIVEGVEGREEMARVAALGFAHAQGYAFGRPDTAGNVGRSLADSWSWSDARP